MHRRVRIGAGMAAVQPGAAPDGAVARPALAVAEQPHPGPRGGAPAAGDGHAPVAPGTRADSGLADRPPAEPNRSRPWRRPVLVVAAVVTLAVGAVLGGAVLGRPDTPAPAGEPAVAGSGGLVLGQVGPTGGSAGDLATSIAHAQQQLRRVPADWPTWAELGLAYVQQARLTADPTYYPRAQGALDRSARLRPTGNHLALTGLGALAAARHDFAAALRYGRQATTIDPYSAPAQGVVVDALIELGRYVEAWPAVQRMLDIDPGLDSLSRASYAEELLGNSARAGELLQQALADASSAADAGYALYYLGELAFNAGDLRTAQARYAEGLRRAPAYLPLLEGRAKTEAASGDLPRAMVDYRSLATRLPQPSYLIEYGDLLAAHGLTAAAEAQYALVRVEDRLFAAQGVNVDLELALFDADHRAPARALAEAQAEYARRPTVAVQDALAWALHVNGRDREALPHARAALALGTRSASFHYHLGVIEASLGDRVGARQELATALVTNPYFSPLYGPRAAAQLQRLGGSG